MKSEALSVFGRSDDETDSLYNNPQNHPARDRTDEVEPELIKFPRPGLVGVIDSEDVKGFEAVKHAKRQRNQTERERTNVLSTSARPNEKEISHGRVSWQSQ
jgi:hypothetical protein